MNRELLKTEDFSYDLPEDRIAKYPLTNRNASKLLICNKGKVMEDVFSNLEKFLPSDAALIFNDTKVVAARLVFFKTTGARIEVFCLEPHASSMEEALNASESCIWECLIGNLKRFKTGEVLEMDLSGSVLKASIHDKRNDKVLVKFEWEGGMPFASILDQAGQVPLPPYLKRESEKGDRLNYQTVYAKTEGAVAAPTAGLHFIDDQLKELRSKGHPIAYLTLYVGAGTFKPVKAGRLVDHQMHGERIVISKSTIAFLAKHTGPLISVGTTSCRSLESLHWLAVKMATTHSEALPDICQEDAYNLPSTQTFRQSCEYLIEFMDAHSRSEVDFRSSLYIMPGYKWKAVDGLITNFHQPASTLLALVASFVGDDWEKIYDYALEKDFRFLSYGDGSLLWRGGEVI